MVLRGRQEGQVLNHPPTGRPRVATGAGTLSRAVSTPVRPWLPVAPTTRVCNRVTLAIGSRGPLPSPPWALSSKRFQSRLSSRIPGCFRIRFPPVVHPALCFLRLGDSHRPHVTSFFAKRTTEVGNHGGRVRKEREKRETRFPTVSAPMFKWVVSLSLFCKLWCPQECV